MECRPENSTSTCVRGFEEGAEHRTQDACGPQGVPLVSSLRAALDHRSSAFAGLSETFREQARIRQSLNTTDHRSLVTDHVSHSLTVSAPV